MPNYRIKETPRGPVIGSYTIKPGVKIVPGQIVEMSKAEFDKTHEVIIRKLDKDCNTVPVKTEVRSHSDWLEEVKEKANTKVVEKNIGTRVFDDGKQEPVTIERAQQVA